MNVPYTRAPHQSGPGAAGLDATHAALLIDFDNVTMGMRSDLSKELKSLLDTDVIKGKVSVQRAYADWRRYPQYIVPLSEASVDLIFAPAYGSNKKNATDIRMAIDALELVFIRPEIGTYILLTGDSDFSSLVLKLKEYGKYVIGVGIQESSSDILVQNCDEYYSYTSLTGLTKTTEMDRDARDPWVLVKEAINKMVQRGDVMRSDRLKQVMQEIDPTFDEGSIGFSKFSKFLSEASSRGLIRLQKMENGQYEVEPGKGRGRGDRGKSDEGRSRGGSRSRGGRSRGGRGRDDRRDEGDAPESPDADASSGESDGDPMAAAYAAIRSALERLSDSGRDPVRDSDLKRKMLDADRNFDEGTLGFPKFSKFLEQAESDGVVKLHREGRIIEVSLASGSVTSTSSTDEAAPEPSKGRGSRERSPRSGRSKSTDSDSRKDESTPAASTPSEVPAESTPGPDGPSDGKATTIEVEPPKRGLFGLRLGPRRGATRRRGGDGGSIFGFGGSSSDKTDSSDADESGTSHGTGVAAAELAAMEAAEAEAAAAAELEDLRIDDEAVDYGDGDDDAVDETADASGGRNSGRRSDGRTSKPQGSRRGESKSRESKPRESKPQQSKPQASKPQESKREAPKPTAGTVPDVPLDQLGLPSDPGAIARYLTHRYKGVGEKTAETLVEKLGTGLFDTLHERPGEISSIVPPKRAEQVLEAWRSDYERRATAHVERSSKG